MVQFIKQEANEKAREIAIATEEEFNIEKLSMVDGEKIKIAKEYERKETTVDTAKKIEASTGRNAMRLKVLSARAQAMETVVEEARAKLAETSADAGRYRTLMTALIVQGARKLGDARAMPGVRCGGGARGGGGGGGGDARDDGDVGRVVESAGGARVFGRRRSRELDG